MKRKENLFFEVHYVVGLKLFSRLRLGFSHSNENKLWHNFKDTANPMCSCSTEIGQQNATYCIVKSIPILSKFLKGIYN